MFTSPWSKEAERILKQLSLYGRGHIKNNNKLPREFGIYCKDIINKDYLDIATVRNKRDRRTLFQIPPGVKVIPKLSRRGTKYHFIREK